METKENLNKGITLVALVITIIILLILAGVAITALTQTGLFENAKQAKNAMENAQTKENATLEDYVNKIDGKISGDRENIENIGVELLTDPIIIDTSTNFEEKNLDFEISDISQYNYLLLTILSNLLLIILSSLLPLVVNLINGILYLDRILFFNISLSFCLLSSL